MSAERLSGDIHEECGVFGVYGQPGAAMLTYYGLFALQHRGQESAGIVASDGKEIVAHKGLGLLTEVFADPKQLAAWTGHLAIGHVRYSTTGSTSLANAQPLLVRYHGGSLALAHNGNLVNASELRAQLEAQGSIFQTTADSEVIAHLIARQGDVPLETAVIRALAQVRGAYAFIFLTEDKLIAARDPNGIRPLSLGRLGDAYVVASETCAFDIIGAETLSDIAPGEMIVIDKDGLHSQQALPQGRPALCVFEYIYFSRPDSVLHGVNVHSARKALGRELAREFPAAGDLVTGVPDSSLSAASGYAEASGIPYEMGLVKNRYVGRTFIQPSQAERSFNVKVKLNALRKVVEGKRVVLVDDSIVRGTTTQHIIRSLREAGAREVHVRISSPPYRHSCYFGVDTSAGTDLIAARLTVEEIRQQVGADSLAYLSVEGLARACGLPGRLCLACFDGDYPVDVSAANGKHDLEQRATS
ncbi:MAG: amidophosphoribosyltransferase [Chloroflexota bacterium]